MIWIKNVLLTFYYGASIRIHLAHNLQHLQLSIIWNTLHLLSLSSHLNAIYLLLSFASFFKFLAELVAPTSNSFMVLPTIDQPSDTGPTTQIATDIPEFDIVSGANMRGLYKQVLGIEDLT